MKLIKNIIVVCLITLNASASSRDTLRTIKPFSVSYNVIQTWINEYDFTGEFRIGKKLGLGLTWGRVRYNYSFDPLFFSTSQDRWPGTVYTGNSIRAFLKYYSLRRLGSYWSLQTLYKKVSYNNHTFEDCLGGCDEAHEWYIRSENATVYGLDLIHGHESNVKALFKDWIWEHPGLGDYILFDFFYGIGTRYRTRDYTTNVISSTFIPRDAIPEGTFHRKQFYYAITLGLRIGFNFVQRKRIDYMKF